MLRCLPLHVRLLRQSEHQNNPLHCSTIPLCSSPTRSRGPQVAQTLATMNASLSALHAAEQRRAAAQSEADTIARLREHVLELTEELEVPSILCLASVYRIDIAAKLEIIRLCQHCVSLSLDSASMACVRRCYRQVRLWMCKTLRRLLSTRVPLRVSRSSKIWLVRLSDSAQETKLDETECVLFIGARSFQ
jgi:hypothetical protein